MNIGFKINGWCRLICLGIFFLFNALPLSAQKNKGDGHDKINPNTNSKIVVEKKRDICFGTFSVWGDGGIVSISPDGEPDYPTGITQINKGDAPQPAVFVVSAKRPFKKSLPISILRGKKSKLTGSNDGSISVGVGDLSIISRSTSGNGKDKIYEIKVSVGGSLIVEGSKANPPGTYIGELDFVFQKN
ncbi:DUF4402 domain-containing protein [Ancylomarina sp. YFZ004]